MSGEQGKLWHFLPFSRLTDDELALPIVRCGEFFLLLLFRAFYKRLKVSQKSLLFESFTFVPLNWVLGSFFCSSLHWDLHFEEKFSINETILISTARLPQFFSFTNFSLEETGSIRSRKRFVANAKQRWKFTFCFPQLLASASPSSEWLIRHQVSSMCCWDFSIVSFTCFTFYFPSSTDFPAFPLTRLTKL